MTEKEKMFAGELYFHGDEELAEMYLKARKLCAELNATPADQKQKRESIVKRLFGKTGEKVFVGQNFECDYGVNIEVGENFFCNYGVVILDVCKVTIGKNCLIAPQVGIYTACHPLEEEVRISGLESGKPITIGDNCWIGGHAVINPGVTLGDNVVVGSGSVVTKSFPSNVVIAGNPAKVIKKLK